MSECRNNGMAERYTKISGFFSDDFYDKKIDFLRKNGPEIWESRVKRLGNLE